MGDVSKIFVKFALGQCPVGRIGCHCNPFHAISWLQEENLATEVRQGDLFAVALGV